MFYLKKNHFAPTDLIIYLIAILSPFSTTYLDKVNVVIILILSCLLLYINLISRHKIKFIDIEKYFLFSYVSFIFISILSLFRALTTVTSAELPNSIVGRFATIFTCILMIVVISDWISRQPTEKIIKFLKASLISTIIFALFSVYQIIAFNYNLPFFETRTSVWGADHEIKQQIGFRLTSITQEPNFYSPILIESILLSYLVLSKRNFILFLVFTLFLIYKTHSTGVYIHFFSIFILFILFFNAKVINRICMLMIILVPGILFFISHLMNDQYFITKMEIEISGESSRAQSYITILSEIFNHKETFNFILGHGLNTLSYFNELSSLSHNLYITVSNNFYIDILWDAGIIGLIMFFLGLLFMARKILKTKKNDYGFISLMLLFSFVITSFYRSEYTSTHFIWVILNIIACYTIALKKVNKKCN